MPFKQDTRPEWLSHPGYRQRRERTANHASWSLSALLLCSAQSFSFTPDQKSTLHLEIALHSSQTSGFKEPQSRNKSQHSREKRTGLTPLHAQPNKIQLNWFFNEFKTDMRPWIFFFHIKWDDTNSINYPEEKCQRKWSEFGVTLGVNQMHTHPGHRTCQFIKEVEGKFPP